MMVDFLKVVIVLLMILAGIVYEALKSFAIVGALVLLGYLFVLALGHLGWLQP